MFRRGNKCERNNSGDSSPKRSQNPSSATNTPSSVTTMSSDSGVVVEMGRERRDGSNSTPVSTRPVGRYTDGLWDPTRDERELIRRSWSDDFDFLFRLGAAIYEYIFAHTPEVKTLFPSIHQWGAEWRESKEFRSQALRFVQTLAHAVQKIYRLDEVAANVYTIGGKHVKYAPRGFKPEYWDMFEEAIQLAIKDHINRISAPDFNVEQKADAVRMWSRLALFIISHMKAGYNDEMSKCEKEGEQAKP